jgi:hypothetical protein
VAVVGYDNAYFAAAALHPHLEDTVLRQSIDRVANKVGDYLEDVAGIHFRGNIGRQASANPDLLGEDGLLVDAQGGFSQSGHGDDFPAFLRPIKTEGLPRKLDEVQDLFFDELAVSAHEVNVIRVLLDEVVEVGNGFKRSVDLVHDDGGKLTGHRKVAIAMHDLFDLLPLFAV